MAHIILTVDLGYGDSGKGTMVDALARNKPTELVVRYSGGAQAMHNVITPDGNHHAFSQIGSGTLVPGVKTYLGPKMLIDPNKILVENRFIQKHSVTDALSRLYIDRKAPVITEFNVVINQTREFERQHNRHGSCGMGIYETRIDSRTYGEEMLFAEDMLNLPRAKQKLLFFREEKLKVLKRDFPHLFGERIHPGAQRAYNIFVHDQFIEETLSIYSRLASLAHITDSQILKDALATDKQVIFEASQGVLLDEDYGFLPHVTGSDVTTRSAHELLDSVDSKDPRYTLGIVRAYMSRHGAGPMVTEDVSLGAHITEPHNSSNHPWQGVFRFGWFDPLAINYAIAANKGVDGLAVTCLDQVQPLSEYKYATAYKNEDGSRVTEITLLEGADDAERLELTRKIQQYTPEYASIPVDTKNILNVIGETCATPIAATSAGRTALEKELFI